MERIESKAIGFSLPGFTDEFVSGEAAESLEPFCKVAGSDKVAVMSAQLFMGVIAAALNRNLFDGAIHDRTKVE